MSRGFTFKKFVDRCLFVIIVASVMLIGGMVVQGQQGVAGGGADGFWCAGSYEISDGSNQEFCDAIVDSNNIPCCPCNNNSCPYTPPVKPDPPIVDPESPTDCNNFPSNRGGYSGGGSGGDSSFTPGAMLVQTDIDHVMMLGGLDDQNCEGGGGGCSGGCGST